MSRLDHGEEASALDLHISRDTLAAGEAPTLLLHEQEGFFCCPSLPKTSRIKMRKVPPLLSFSHHLLLFPALELPNKVYLLKKEPVEQWGKMLRRDLIHEIGTDDGQTLG